MKPCYSKKSSAGDIAIYITLVLSVVMLTSAIFMSLILVRQLQLSRNVEWSERALYAANSGLEEILYHLSQRGEATYSIAADSRTINYGSENATYSTVDQGALLDPTLGGPCIPRVEGTYHAESRRLSMMSPGCVMPP